MTDSEQKVLSRKRVLVLHSGGLDSSTLLMAMHRAPERLFPWWKKGEKVEYLVSLGFKYGQRHSLEYVAANELGNLIWKESERGTFAQRFLPLDPEIFGSGSSLMRSSKEEVPASEGVKEIRERGEGLPSTYIPFRNLVLLSLAASYSQQFECGLILYGANAIDSSGYPDCRPVFVNSLNRTLYQAHVPGWGDKELRELGRLYPHPVPESPCPAIAAPIISKRKSEIVELAAEVGVPFEHTWSCYNPDLVGVRGRERALPCGKCDSCLLRAEGFKEAGLSDPLIEGGLDLGG